MLPYPLVPFQRPFPSANGVLVLGEEPVLIDSGFGSDFGETERLLREANVPPESLHLVVNTHYHCDHAGGNHALQTRYGVPVAAHRWEGTLVNHRDRDACSAVWLRQPVEAYKVNRFLQEGDEIPTGAATLRVLHTPGHTLGHLSFYEPRNRVLILGDAVHGDDVSWINPFREGAGALQRAMETLEHLLTLAVRIAVSGHSAPFENVGEVFRGALKRYGAWSREPERAAWHGVKRLFAYALMLEGGLQEERLETYLLASPWFYDYSRYAFGATPETFVTPLLQEMLRSRAARWEGGCLMATAPYRPLSPAWRPTAITPDLWPPTD